MAKTVRFVAKKALFNFLGNTFRMYDSEGQLRFYIRQKAFRLKEDLRVFSDASQDNMVLSIRARNWADARGRFDFRDAKSDAIFGGAKRNMFKSVLLDDWDLFDENDAQVGKLQECRSWTSWLRKLFRWIPQTYRVSIGEQEVGTIRQRFNPLQLVYDIEFKADFDQRIVISTAVLMLAIESKYD